MKRAVKRRAISSENYSIPRAPEVIRSMEMVFRATHKREMTAAERKDFHLPRLKRSGAVAAPTTEAERVVIVKPRRVVLQFERSFQRSPRLVKAMEDVFRATHKREMTNDERKEFRLPAIEESELLVAA